MEETGADSNDNVLILNSNATELERLTAFLDAYCAKAGLSEQLCYRLQVALEELVLNAINHGRCDPQEGAIRLVVRREGDEIRVVLSDTGVAFNPLEAPAPDLTASLRSRPVGGLGIHLVRHLMPSVRYERLGGRNYLYLASPVSLESGTLPPEEERHANGNGDNKG